MTRIMVSILYAFLLGSVFISTAYNRKNYSWTEDQAAALIGTVFLSLNVVGTTGEQDNTYLNLCQYLVLC